MSPESFVPLGKRAGGGGVSALVGIDANSITLVSFVLAFVGGLISFLSPCVLPVVPGYLSAVTGLDVTGPSDGTGAHSRRIAFTTGLCTEAIDLLYTASGARALFTRNALQRQFRDAHAIANHIAFNMDIATAAHGRVALGLETDNPIV